MTNTPESNPSLASVENEVLVGKMFDLQQQVDDMYDYIQRFRKAFGVRLSVTLFAFLASWILAFSCASLFVAGPKSVWVAVAFFIAFGVCLVGGLVAMSGLQGALEQLDANLREAEARREAMDAEPMDEEAEEDTDKVSALSDDEEARVKGAQPA